jgi:short-subunit dehydrogenase
MFTDVVHRYLVSIYLTAELEQIVQDMYRGKIVVVTGAGAGVGRATAREFAMRGCDVALLSRDPTRIRTAAAELRGLGVRALAIPTDVADPAAVEAAAERTEQELGPIDIWVNVAMATVFSPVEDLSVEEVKRGTEVTYLGQAYGMMSALKRMRPRNRGAIVNVGSALAYRSVPLQAIYCGAKAAIRGFTDSLRCELLHEHSNIHITMVQLPAVNTPQFDWAMNKTGYQARPVAPVYEPEVPAKAIVFAAFHKRREVWVGIPTVAAIVGNFVAPGLLDRYLGKTGYRSQTTRTKLPPNHPNNLYEPVEGDYGQRGRFTKEAYTGSLELFTDRHQVAGYVALGGILLWLHLLAKKYDF